MKVHELGRVNGTRHAAAAQKERVRRIRLLITIGAALTLLGVYNVVSIDADMNRVEQAGPERLALAGSGLSHFVPSILANLQRAQQSPTTVTAILEGDPRHSLAFVADKRALERWTALTGLGLAVLFIGLQSRIPSSTAQSRSPTGTDLSRLLILLSLSYGALSVFENG